MVSFLFFKNTENQQFLAFGIGGILSIQEHTHRYAQTQCHLYKETEYIQILASAGQVWEPGLSGSWVSSMFILKQKQN